MAAIAQRLGIEQKEAPEIDARTEFWLGVFRRLSPSRQYTHGIAVNIPVSEMRAYCEFSPVAAAPDEFMYVVGELDDAYLEHQAKKRERSSKTAKK